MNLCRHSTIKCLLVQTDVRYMSRLTHPRENLQRMENQKQCGHNESFLVDHLLYNDRFTCLPRVGYCFLKTATDSSHEAIACWGSKSRNA